MVLQSLVTACTVSNVQLLARRRLGAAAACITGSAVYTVHAYTLAASHGLPGVACLGLFACAEMSCTDASCVMTLCHMYTCTTVRMITVRSQT